MKTKYEFINRVQAPTPGFFKTIRHIGITLGAVGTALLTAPVVLPAVITAAAGYLVTAGLVATAIASAAVADSRGNGDNASGGTPDTSAGSGEGAAP
ncbi:hypothetical protein [Parapedobacter lycopersici]|uniref:hypothetical protein n=1 Tax=Parapedobacter lycopersici TaxID=1864939 RepID=UPI00214D9547|nr:hypothetical protein [Parapedobacter lycopersici]